MGDNAISVKARPLLIVGLGNPGQQYDKTYHNLGFETVARLADLVQAEPAREKYRAVYRQWTHNGRKIFLIQPQTFMNLSGESVGEFVNFFKCLPEEDLVVVTDDLDLPPGKLRMRRSGGAGGHNGLKSIILHLGTENFPRIRIGIGRHASAPADRYVLMKIGASEHELYGKSIERAVETLKLLPEVGLPKAMDHCNRPEDGEEKK